MKATLQHTVLQNFKLASGKTLDVNLSWQIFGCDLHTAPIVLINHALTGNSDVAGEKGWWKTLVGKHKTVDTDRYTVISFNIPGNGYDGFLTDNYTDFLPSDIAGIFLQGLKFLKITHLYALVGGSLGGAIGWEMLNIQNGLADNFIPIACDYRTSDWLHAQCLVQKFLLESDEKPLQKARVHAMLCYRTPESLNMRFNRQLDIDKKILKSHDWLNYHGEALNERFSLKAYRLVNHLLMNVKVPASALHHISANIYLIAVDTDLFFPAFEIKKCFDEMKTQKQNIFYHEIKSIHGHDAFLMEYQQLNNILNKIF